MKMPTVVASSYLLAVKISCPAELQMKYVLCVGLAKGYQIWCEGH